MGKSMVLGVVSVLFLQISIGQKIDNLASFRDIESDNYFRFHYDNDFFAAADKNYTQGYQLEVVAPFFKDNPINHLLYKPKNAKIRYGLALEHIGFTPDKYELQNIQFGDRPFASAIMLKNFIISTDEANSSRISSAFSVGIIGQAAFGEEMQVGIHKAIGDKIPLGWRNQIKNDLVLNYEMGYEKQLLKYREFIALQGMLNAKLGTLFTNVSIGATTTFGINNSPFSSTKKRNSFHFYGFAQPVLNIIGYDATLQGGLFNKKSPYTISTGDVERITGQVNYGLVLKTKTLYFEYTRSIISREFNTGSSYKWGGIKIGFML